FATVAACPSGMRAQYNLGVALLDARRLFDARAAFERAYALDPDDRDVLIGLATASGKIGDFRRAVELASRAVAEREDAAALTLLGWSQLNAGNPEAAVKSFERALELAPGSDDARRGLGQARSRGVRF